MSIDPEYVQRIAALERKVSDLYQALGRSEPKDSDLASISPEVEQLIARNNLIEAVKVHRDQTGLDLAAAKKEIDNYLNQGG